MCVMILGVVVDDNDVVMRGWFRGLMLNLSCVFYFSFDWVYENLCDEEFFKEKKIEPFYFILWRWWRINEDEHYGRRRRK